MSGFYTEADYENSIIELFQNMGYRHVYGPDVERDFYSPLYEEELTAALYRLNPTTPEEAIADEDTFSYMLTTFKSSWEENRNLTKNQCMTRLDNSFFVALDTASDLLRGKFKHINSASRVYKILDDIYSNLLKEEPNLKYMLLSEPLPWFDWAADHCKIRYYIYETPRGGWIVQINPNYAYSIEAVKQLKGVVYVHSTGSLAVCTQLGDAVAITREIESRHLFAIKDAK